MTNPNLTKKLWVVLPASGIGSRMQSSIPKQYLPFQNKTVIETTIDRLLSCDHVNGVVVVLNGKDTYWNDLNYSHKKPVLICTGDETRSGSVLNGLEVLKERAKNSGLWVMIHDAVRPCISQDDLNNLVAASSVESQGLFLAHPVTDTLKKSDDEQRSMETIDRTSLWRALTPQMFPFELIYKALKNVLEHNISVSDDVSAIEAIGLRPKIIIGRSDNIKITYPEDVLIAEILIKTIT